jgi:hypothetical protein
MITKDKLKSIEIIKKQKLTMKSVPKANERLKVMFCALNGASQRRVSKEKNEIYNKVKLGFWLPDQRKCARSHLRCAQALVGLQGSCGARLSDGARARADVVFTLDRRLLSSSADALNRVLHRLERRCTRSQNLCARLH